MQRRLSVRPARLLIIGFAISLTACAVGKARVNQFDKFAHAGIQFTDAIPPLLDEAFLAAVTIDSLALKQGRTGLPSEDDRLKEIEKSNENLTKRIAILNDLKRHATLLRAYFAALQVLAQTDAESSGMTTVANGLVATLGKLHPKIANASIGGSPVSDLVAPVTSFAFTAYQSAVLNRELRQNAATIDSELNLQQAALTAIADAMKADLQTQFAALDRDAIVLPYARGKPLPSDWTQRRVDAFHRQLQMHSVDAVAKAAQSLRTSFVALVENRLDDTGITLLLRDINDIVALVEAIHGTE